MPTTETGTPPVQGPSLEEAARMFEGLLDAEEAPQGTQDTAKPAADAAPGNDAVTSVSSESVAAEATSQETPAEETQVEEAEASTETEDQEAAPEKPSTVTVKVNGKTEEVPFEEVVAGYQRNVDYSRKMTALGEERKAFETEARAVKEERETYSLMLANLRDQLQEMQPVEPDWAEVHRTDPIGYARRRDEWRDKQEKIAAAKFELARLQDVKSREAAVEFERMKVQKRAELLDMNPVWKDPKVWEADRQAILEFARSRKYTDEELTYALDPRAIVIMDEARRYRELMANKPKPVEVQRPRLASAGAAPESTAVRRLNAAQQRLAKSGRIDDAAKVWEQLL